MQKNTSARKDSRSKITPNLTVVSASYARSIWLLRESSSYCPILTRDRATPRGKRMALSLARLIHARPSRSQKMSLPHSLYLRSDVVVLSCRTSRPIPHCRFLGAALPLFHNVFHGKQSLLLLYIQGRNPSVLPHYLFPLEE